MQTNVTEVVGCDIAHPYSDTVKNSPRSVDLPAASAAISDYCSRTLTLALNAVKIGFS